MCFEFKIISFSLFSGYHFGVYISEIKPYEGADNDLVKPLEVGQEIKAINGKSLAGKSYFEIVEIIRDARPSNPSYTLNLLVEVNWYEPKKKPFEKISCRNRSCCTLL